MKVCLVSSEVSPFAKTGGLADVCGALPKELAKERTGESQIEPILFMPLYRTTREYFAENLGSNREEQSPLLATDLSFSVKVGTRKSQATVYKSTLPATEIPIYFIENDRYFDRASLYREGGVDYVDNCERYIFFCRAVTKALILLDEPVDLLHCNDWQTGLLPALLKIEYNAQKVFKDCATLQTIHNLAYQGSFWHWDMALTGIDWKYFNWQQMEFHGNLNLLKTGIVFADWISTVSPRYSEEIQTEAFGCGLETVLQFRQNTLSGIVNGIDYRIWNPETDNALVANYSAEDRQGKLLCKDDLQKEFSLPVDRSVPTIGMISRLADQKGLDLVLDLLPKWLRDKSVQWLFLGTGEPHYHQALEDLARRYPDKLSAKLTFNETLAHKIEGGADLFLMPSAYEPCGLNQLYSLRYGTLPIVRLTGGLADTIVPYSSNAQKVMDHKNRPNGFGFSPHSSEALEKTLELALSIWEPEQEGEIWNNLVDHAMALDWSWKQSAAKYYEAYSQAQMQFLKKNKPLLNKPL
ncbi:MAG: glycogen synthase [Pirellulaceae bacterium]|nr:glycogen synthase [Pirellulaceae bacterium]